jgi:hypothetical protein
LVLDTRGLQAAIAALRPLVAVDADSDINPTSIFARTAIPRYEALLAMAQAGVPGLTNPPSEAQLTDYARSVAETAMRGTPPPSPQQVLDAVGAATHTFAAAFYVHNETEGAGGDVDYHVGRDSHHGVSADGRTLGDCETFAFEVSRHMMQGALQARDTSGRTLADQGYRLASVIRTPESHIGEAHVVVGVFNGDGAPVSVMSNHEYYSASEGANPLESAFTDVRLPRGTAARDAYYAPFPVAAGASPVTIGSQTLTPAPEL